MPIPLLRKVFRERRRATLVAALAFLALRLAGPDAIAATREAAAVALVLGAVAGLGAALAPRLRSFAEAVALAGFGYAGLLHALPGSALDPGAAAGHPLVALAFPLALVALARGLRRGLRALPGPLLRNRSYKARAGSRLDIHRLWYGLVPSAAQGAQPGDPRAAAIADMSLRLGRVRLLPQTAASTLADARLQVLEVEPPFHIRMRTTGWTGDGMLGETGISELFLVELGHGRLVLFTHEFADMPLGRALLAWLDDAPGRLLDRRLATIERRARYDDAQRGAPDAGTGRVRGAAVAQASAAAAGAVSGAGTGEDATTAAWDADAARDVAAPTPDADATRKVS